MPFPSHWRIKIKRRLRIHIHIYTCIVSLRSSRRRIFFTEAPTILMSGVYFLQDLTKDTTPSVLDSAIEGFKSKLGIDESGEFVCLVLSMTKNDCLNICIYLIYSRMVFLYSSILSI